jgi:hypothetical protein
MLADDTIQCQRCPVTNPSAMSRHFTPSMKAASVTNCRGVGRRSAVPNALRRTIQGEDHNVAADLLAPVLVEFFN